MASGTFKETLFLFTSSLSELYRRDLLNVCCYAEGWQIEFGYRKSHVPDNVISNLDSLQDSPVVVVFCEPYDQADVFYRYHPIRRGRVLKARKERDDSLTLSLELQQVFDYLSPHCEMRVDEFQVFVNNSNVRPKTYKSERLDNARQNMFVRPDTAYFPADHWKDWGQHWSPLVSYCSRLKGLRDCFFMRLPPAPVASSAEQANLFPEPVRDAMGRLLWSLQTDCTYTLRFEVKHGEELTQGASKPKVVRVPPTLACRIELITILGPYERQLGDGTEVEFLLAPKRIFGRDYSTFVARVEPEGNGKVRSPEFYGALVIQPPWGLLWLTIALLVVGSAILSLDSTLIEQLVGNPAPNPTASLKGKVALVLLKLLGAFLLGSGSYLGFRKLPLKT